MAKWTGRQFHNQPAESHQHRFLAGLWDEVRASTAGEVDIEVCPLNGGVAGSDPRALELVRAGEVQFGTFMGPLLAHAVPAAEIQGVPFAFDSAAQALAAADGELGEFIRREAQAQGLWLVPWGTLDNGLRHMCTVEARVRRAEDLAGLRIRVPRATIISEAIEAFGATPVMVDIDGLYAALAARRVDGHENPLAITEVNRLYQVTRHVALTAHLWSGFNLVGHLGFWRALPEGARAAIERATRTHVARQRAYTAALNARLEHDLAAERGMTVDTVDRDALRARLGSESYARWRRRLGGQAWRLLTEASGRPL